MKRIITLIITLALYFTATAQCDVDRHSTTWFDGWTACSPAMNPNTVRGNSYWIQYDFGETYTLEQMHFWNFNDPAHKSNGLKNIVIDYSMNGVTWTEWGTHLLLQAPGISTYEGISGPDLDGLQAKYLLITAIDNWGGDCYGLSELKIDLGNSISTITTLNTNCLNAEIYPNPILNQAAMVIGTICPGSISYTISTVLGTPVHSENLGTIDNKLKIALPVEDLAPGVYIVTITQLSSSITKQIVVL